MTSYAQSILVVVVTQSKMASRGGFTCCVTSCFSNAKRNRELSFYGFSKDKNLRKVWLQKISRKGFKPTTGHRVCSQHFVGDQKTYMNNVPTIFPLSKTHQTPKPKKRRQLVQATTSGVTTFNDVSKESTLPITDDDLEELHHKIDGTTAVAAAAAQTSTPDEKEPLNLEEKFEQVQKELEDLSVENERLQTKIESLQFGFRRFIASDDDMNYYTAMSSGHFLAFYGFLNAEGVCSRLKYWGSDNSSIQFPDIGKKGQKRLLEPKDELFLTLARLRVNISEKVIADNCNISVAEVSRIFVTWLDLMYSRLIQLPAWAAKKTVQNAMPESFRQKYPLTRVIIDCTDIFIEKPSSFRAQSDTYSSYKSHNTAKGLVGISPNGAVTFVSELYGEHCSDKTIVEDCGILELLEEGYSVMADRGFEIQDLLSKKKVYLNIPPFMRCKDQLSPEEEDETREIASIRIHVERAIEWIKNCNILKQIVPNSMAEDLNKIWKVCCLLSNLKEPLVI